MRETQERAVPASWSRWFSLTGALVLMACGSRGETQLATDYQAAAERIIPRVEQAVGLSFRTPPNIAVRTKQEVAAYLAGKLESELPPEKLDGIAAAYGLFGLIPDTLDLRSLLHSLYSEQVAGYFDPDSNALYLVEGTDPVQVSLVLAHELAHALQAQYVALDSLLDADKPNDVAMAAQAVLEGQAVLASIRAMLPDRDLDDIPDFRDIFQATIEQQQSAMPVFSAAPAIIREGLIFPYLDGAIFVDWFDKAFRDTVPYGPRLPVSTEQILHTDRYRAGDVPVMLRFLPAVGLVYQDGLGEFEIRILLSELSGSKSVGRAGALGWDGDQFAVLDAGPGDFALVWWTVWDNQQAADRFESLLRVEWLKKVEPSRRFEVERSELGGQPAVRLVDAPERWSGWSQIPSVEVEPS